MKMSNLYMPTLREVPNDADIESAQFLLRAGMIRKLVSGVYSYLPLGFRIMKKVEQIVREEMDAYGAQEVLMSAIQPREIWEQSNRWENFGPEMFRLKDRNDREFCLGPTHEEFFTFLVTNELKSYKQLPLNLYQIQTKYRDERRPRFGLIRSREFIMKDAYTFDVDQEASEKSYENMWRAYVSAFNRIGFKYKVVQGDSGNMGGNVSHEFIAITPNGESTIAYCDACDYAATDEVAAAIFEMPAVSSDSVEREKIHTPGVTTIEALEESLGASSDSFIKAVLLKTEDNRRYFAVFVPGHRVLNMTKLSKQVGEAEDSLMFVSDDEILEMGSYPGFSGPFGLKEHVEVILDKRVLDIRDGICGANEKDYHLKHVALTGEQFTVAEDIVSVGEGDKCPCCGAPLAIDCGTEVGNIFQLGDKYSKALNATFLDKDGKAKPFVMGSYGIGISRCVAAVAEQNFDEKGIAWPLSIAPYHVLITVVNAKNALQMERGLELYETLKAQGVEVIIDDRNERAGVKFTDADLIGIPVRVTVGKGIQEGVVEFSLRKDMEKSEVPYESVLERIQSALV
ncbi:proline--tRNA ligase [Fusibacter sp. JL298sf-3]